jgi:protein PhnA
MQMNKNNLCPSCKSENIYADGNLWICPECGHEWSAHATPKSEDVAVVDDSQIRDSFGNLLQDGDSVTVIKELKIKGSSSAVKVGTKVRNIHLVDGHDGHNIACKIDGIGAINLKSEFVKKA